MRLSDFIRAEMEPILQQWQKFAKTIFTARYLTPPELRDHAKEILLAIADDLAQPQSKRQQVAKSKGHAPDAVQDTPAETHGVERHTTGFSIYDTISEFRALRASVISLWSKTTGTFTGDELEDLTRFNEAIDQAITESLSRYAIEQDMQTRLFSKILLVSPDPIYVLDLKGRFVFANRATTALLGLPEKLIIGKNAQELNLPFADKLQQQLQFVIKSKKTIRGELEYSFSGGQGNQFEYLLAPVFQDQHKVDVIVGISRDITERKIADEKIWHNANYDLLTGLANRRLLLERLEQQVKQALRSGITFAVLFIDLDGFKQVNDLAGHQAGDRLLCLVSERLNACVRDVDTVARIGGDEFTIIITGLKDQRHVSGVSQKILQELARPFEVFGQKVQIGGSIGISLFPDDASTPDELLRTADQAMYLAKKAGRNQVNFFKPSTTSAVK
jgi:diguanylate cyclase (GGDEF)-like protein/PAS domain S-box-containing protein